MAKRKYRILSENETLETPKGGIVEVDNKRLEAELVARGAMERVRDSDLREEKTVAGKASESHSRDNR